ncbi:MULTISPECIES: flagellar filament capping protein FliD [Pseudomonas]|jgi:flagellar hook-associated protein 2|uniref:Flagellar hook-associated protein 2 n=1 Tax=Pseudomonas citronellolis TaxID=53408 RepID=A0A1A9KBC9_9PSED|nr:MULTISPECIES: flagellar filament capping protein FliD [Pseudomonas]ANI14855.1 flagellar hook protein FliD [Pseudomonas citronellolis]KRV79654.1 flagellar hook protein FliD [Pseudomonas citronellolis]KRW75850.1 flagellar hook protein FliD [Pseudomonas citronellolis]KWR84719.1 flagellar hook protein FliD [Pseudomonas sp. PI1]WAB91413.1 flagellar filament capping protein FliD [Pseudomonas citronellolis]
MATIDSDYVQQMATQLAQYDIQASQTRLNRNKTSYNSELSAVTQLKSALSTFSSAVSGLKSSSSSTSNMLVNSATFSAEGYATASVGSTAVSGSYQFFVKQLAAKDQVALQGLSDGDLGSGELTIGQGSDSFRIDMSGITSLSALASAINGASDNTGVKATLVRSDGAVNLVLTSDESGEDQAITLSSSNAAMQGSIDARKQLSSAQDAIVYLGGQGGIELRNASNTFDKAIDGVSLTFTKVSDPAEAPLSLDIGRDKDATSKKLQGFLDAYNTLMSSIGTLTASGSGSTTRGALAGDSAVQAIKSAVNGLIRTSFGGVNLIGYGVSADSSGKLTLDSSKLEKALAQNADGFEQLFSDKGNLIDSLSSALKTYTSSTSGLLTSRVNSLNDKLADIDDQFDDLQTRYNNSYARYLKQYTNLMQVMNSMDQTSSMFT